MKSRRARESRHKYALVVQYAAAGTVTVLGAVMAVKSPSIPVAFLRPIVASLQRWAWIVLVVAGPTAALAKIYSDAIAQPWVWKGVETILEEFRKHVFSEECADGPQHHHRATLFRHVQCKFWVWPWRGVNPWGGKKWPCSGWLVPVARSGHTTQQTTVLFCAPDEADEAEGVAGLTWSKGGIIYVPDLPDLTSPNGTDADEYIELTATPRKLLRKRVGSSRKLPRALCGIPIFSNGSPWGVLVLDSRDPNGIKDPTTCAAAIGIGQRLLNSFFESR